MISTSYWRVKRVGPKEKSIEIKYYTLILVLFLPYKSNKRDYKTLYLCFLSTSLTTLF